MSDALARKSCRSATELAAAVRDGHISAARIARDTLDAIEKRGSAYNCFTAVTADRAVALDRTRGTASLEAPSRLR